MRVCNLFGAGRIQLSEADDEVTMNATPPKLNPTVYFPPRASTPKPPAPVKVADRKV